MTIKEFYNLAYAPLKSVTPILADCGELCNKACCDGGEDDCGMYLFPFEEKLYSPDIKWQKIYDTDFEYLPGKFAKLLVCDNTCDRSLRPLACRIFPLVPYAKRGEKLQIIIDPRAKGMCPLAKALKISDFDLNFVNAVRMSMLILFKNPLCREFIYSLSSLLDEYNIL